MQGVNGASAAADVELEMLALRADIAGVEHAGTTGQVHRSWIVFAEGLQSGAQPGQFRTQQFVQSTFGVDLQGWFRLEKAQLGFGDVGEALGHLADKIVADSEAGGGLVSTVANQQIAALRNGFDEAEVTRAAGTGNQVVGVGAGEGDGGPIEGFGEAAGDQAVDPGGVSIIVGDDDGGHSVSVKNTVDGDFASVGG